MRTSSSMTAPVAAYCCGRSKVIAVCSVMAFKVGDRVRYNPNTRTCGLPEWYRQTAEIVVLGEPIAGHGDCLSADVRMDDGQIQRGIKTTMLLPIEDGLVYRNDPVEEACPHCNNEHAELLPPVGDRGDYHCPRCGYFSVDGTNERLFELGFKDSTTAGFVVLNGRRWLKPL